MDARQVAAARARTQYGAAAASWWSRACVAMQRAKRCTGSPHQWLTTHSGGCGASATISTNEHRHAMVAGASTYRAASCSDAVAGVSAPPCASAVHPSAAQRRSTCAHTAWSCRSVAPRRSGRAIVHPLPSERSSPKSARRAISSASMRARALRSSAADEPAFSAMRCSTASWISSACAVAAAAAIASRQLSRAGPPAAAWKLSFRPAAQTVSQLGSSRTIRQPRSSTEPSCRPPLQLSSA